MSRRTLSRPWVAAIAALFLVAFMALTIAFPVDRGADPGSEQPSAQVEESVDATPYVELCFEAGEGRELTLMEAEQWFTKGTLSGHMIDLEPDKSREGWFCGQLEITPGVVQEFVFYKRHGLFENMEVCHMQGNFTQVGLDEFDGRVCEPQRCSEAICRYVPILLTQEDDLINISVLATWPTSLSGHDMPMFRH